MIISVKNSNTAMAKEQSKQLYEVLMLAKKARKAVEAKGIVIPLHKVEMLVDFEEKTCDASYDSKICVSHKIDDLDVFVNEVSAIFAAIAEGGEKSEQEKNC